MVILHMCITVQWAGESMVFSKPCAYTSLQIGRYSLQATMKPSHSVMVPQIQDSSYFIEHLVYSKTTATYGWPNTRLKVISSLQSTLQL